MASYDLPAVIKAGFYSKSAKAVVGNLVKFIQNQTQQGINYVGHSQGGMIALLALNEKPHLQLGWALASSLTPSVSTLFKEIDKKSKSTRSSRLYQSPKGTFVTNNCQVSTCISLSFWQQRIWPRATNSSEHFELFLYRGRYSMLSAFFAIMWTR